MKNIFRRKPKEKKPRTMSVTREYFELITETLIYVFFVMTFLLQSFVIPTGSMVDTLLVGDHLFVDKVAYSHSLGGLDRVFLPQVEIKRGDIVTFKAPHEMEKEYVKRVIGIPGDRIRIIDKIVYVNEKPIHEERYVHYDSPDGLLRSDPRVDNFPPQDADPVNSFNWYQDYTKDSVSGQIREVKFPEAFRRSVVDSPVGKAFLVPPGHYFCMGDARYNSLDSRCWGPVPAEYIIGKPWRIYWSYEARREDYESVDFFDKVKDLVRTIVNFFPKTDWKRTLRKVS